jgi:aspartate carbamoyltransferase catalytic subunit
MSIVNRGEGEEYHPVQTIEGDKKMVCSVVSFEVSRAGFLEPAIWCAHGRKVLSSLELMHSYDLKLHLFLKP